MTNKLVKISEIVWDPKIYPRGKWNTSTIERYADAIVTGSAFEVLEYIVKLGTMKRAANALNTSVSWIYNQLPDQEFVYFIQSIDKIKIGISHGKRFTGRVQSFHVDNPHGLSLVAAIFGDVKTEDNLHKIFSKWRISGEWFEAIPVLLYLNNQQYGLEE